MILYRDTHQPPDLRNCVGRGYNIYYYYYLGVQRNIGDGARAIVQVHVELLQGQLLVQELAQVALQQVTTYFLLYHVRPGDEPGHLLRLIHMERRLYSSDWQSAVVNHSS